MSEKIKSSRYQVVIGTVLTVLFAGLWAIAAGAANVPDSDKQDDPDFSTQVQSSPIAAPEPTDLRFVVDAGPGLDTGCTFRSGGPLVFDIPVTRHFGVIEDLVANGAIAETVELEMPAFDVDFAGAPDVPPERDRVLFNGEVVQGEFLTGTNNTWKMNSFTVPIDQVRFPSDPGEGGSIEPRLNRVEIQIDTASPPDEQNWCTAIDWAKLEIEEAARPHLLVHGIFSEGETWMGAWTEGLESLGIPFHAIDMGRLDSIGANAGKIAGKVAELRDRWGVDALNLVAHSKGGIDSRHYIETAQDVVRLIQIGTPNAGSPLADYLEGAALRILGPVGNLIANALAGGPGGYQLTTGYMALYNRFHSFNPLVRYIAMGGVYSGGGFVDTFLNNIIPGDDDTIVPLSSVHALGFAQPMTFRSSGANREAAHTGQQRSPSIFNRLLPITTQPQGPAFGKAASKAHQLPVPTATITDILTTGESQSKTVPVDSDGPGTFTLFYGTGDLDLTLVSPSGVRVDPGFASGDPAIEFEADETVEGFRIESYRFESLEIGEWTAEIVASTLPEPPFQETYFLSAWLDQPVIHQAVTTDQESYAVGESVVARSTLTENGVAHTGAEVEGIARLPDETLETFMLRDDGAGPDTVAGDGVYAGKLDTLLPGIHRLRIESRGDSPPFSRSDNLIVPVSASTTTPTGGFAERVVDLNGNGLFDELIVDMTLDVSDTATYLATAVLSDGDGRVIDSTTVRRELTPDDNNIELPFDGRTVFDSRIDGPYWLVDVRLAEEQANGDPLPLATLDAPFQTSAFGFREFEHPPIFLPGTGTDEAVDTDGDGKFDRLDVTLDVDLLESGFYQWSARLVDAEGTEIGFSAVNGFLNAGADTLALFFDGRQIGENGVDGPYQVVDLLIFGAGQSRTESEVYSTFGYSASDFEGFNQPPICADAAAEPDLLWPPNHGMVEVAIEGITDPDGDAVSIIVEQVRQDEPVNGTGDGDTAPDASTENGTVRLRAEHSGEGDGRVYHVGIRAEDELGAHCRTDVTVCVPHDLGDASCVDGGPLFDSTGS